MKFLFKMGLVVLASTVFDCAMLYFQAREGKRFPFKVKINPVVDPGGDE